MTLLGNVLHVDGSNDPTFTGRESASTYRFDDETGRTLQVVVHYDEDKQQSWAVAKVLSADLTWTTLATEHPAVWHHLVAQRHIEVDQVEAIGQVSNKLLERALAILGVRLS